MLATHGERKRKAGCYLTQGKLVKRKDIRILWSRGMREGVWGDLVTNQSREGPGQRTEASLVHIKHNPRGSGINRWNESRGSRRGSEAVFAYFPKKKNEKKGSNYTIG